MDGVKIILHLKHWDDKFCKSSVCFGMQMLVSNGICNGNSFRNVCVHVNNL